MSGYKYSPLQGNADTPFTRFVELESGAGALQFSLFQGPLTSTYEALSYVWGDVSKTQLAYCESTSVSITKNLATALRHLRPAAGKRVLWIDAICINQLDNEEKAQQIRMMGDIYRCASRVVVWLGDSDQYTDAAFAKARELAKAWREDRIGYVANGRATVAPFDKGWKSFDLLFTRPWFFRVWIIQEAFVNKKVLVHCGNFSIPWSELHDALTIALPTDNRPPHSVLFDGREDYQKGMRSDLASIVCRFQDFQSTNSKDKIYALLGLINTEEAMTVSINYDAPVDDVYMTWTIGCINKRGNLDILGCVNKPDTFAADSEMIELPSWVPNWSKKRECFSLCYYRQFSSSYREFRASPKSLPGPISMTKDRTLTLRGHQFAEIDNLGMIAEDKESDPLKIPFIDDAVNEWINQTTAKLRWQLNWETISGVRKEQPYITGESILDAYWQTLCAGCADEQKDGIRREFSVFDKDMKTLKFLHRYRLSASRSVLHFLVLSLFLRRYILPIPKSTGWPFAERMIFAKGRRMAMLSNRFIGLVPPGSRKSDQVWLLEGAPVPFVLRKRETGQCWTLVGEAYVHGIMRGEAFDELKVSEVIIN